MAIPNNTLTVTIFIATLKGQWSNGLYYEPASALPADTNMVTLANTLFTLFQPKFTPLLNVGAHFVGIKTHYVNTTIDIEGFSTAGAEPGELSDGTLMPDQDCLEIRRLTGKPGRSNRGRIFVSGLDSSINDDGRLHPSYWTAAQTLAASLSADITGSVTLHARHWNRKTASMVVVTSARPLVRLVSRRDRARPLKYNTI